MKTASTIISRKFDGVDDTMLGDTFVAATPYTLACWVKPNSFAAIRSLMSLEATTGTNSFTDYAGIYINTNGTVGASTETANATTSNTCTLGQWAHVVGRFVSETSRFAYLNGSGSAEETTERGANALTKIRVSGRYTTVEDFMSGEIAWPALWDIALTPSEIRMLASGVRPTKIRPEKLMRFWDFRGGDLEYPVAHSRLVQSYITSGGSVPGVGPHFLNQVTNRTQLFGGFIPSGGGLVPKLITSNGNVTERLLGNGLLG